MNHNEELLALRDHNNKRHLQPGACLRVSTCPCLYPLRRLTENRLFLGGLGEVLAAIPSAARIVPPPRHDTANAPLLSGRSRSSSYLTTKRGYLPGVNLTVAKRQRDDLKTSGPCKTGDEGALAASLSGRDPRSLRFGVDSLFSLNSAGSRGESGPAVPLRPCNLRRRAPSCTT